MTKSAMTFSDSEDFLNYKLKEIYNRNALRTRFSSDYSIDATPNSGFSGRESQGCFIPIDNRI